MTKQDFELIASVVSKCPKAYRRSVAADFALELSKANPRFDLETFLKACDCGNVPALIEALAKIRANPPGNLIVMRF